MTESIGARGPTGRVILGAVAPPSLEPKYYTALDVLALRHRTPRGVHRLGWDPLPLWTRLRVDPTCFPDASVPTPSGPVAVTRAPSQVSISGQALATPSLRQGHPGHILEL